jgi:hypothetical protein
MVIELWAVEAFVFRLLLLLVLRNQLLCAFLSLIFLCGMMPFSVVGVLPMLEKQVTSVTIKTLIILSVSYSSDLHPKFGRNFLFPHIWSMYSLLLVYIIFI